MPRNVKLANSVTLSAPASKLSAEQNKITTLNVTSGPKWSFGRWSFNVAGSFAHNFYEPKEEEEHEDEDHLELTSSRSRKGFRLDGDHPPTNPINPYQNPATTLPVDGHEEEHKEEHDEREWYRYGVNSNISYRFTPRISNTVGGGVFQVLSMGEESSYESNVTISQVNYSLDSLTCGAGVTASGTGESLSAPNVFAIGLSLEYEIE